MNLSTAPDAEGLNPIWQWLLERLKRAPGERACPLRLMTLASIDGQGRPHSRLVVLRAFDPVQVIASFYTDARSPKLLQLQQRPHVSLMFYDPQAKVQIRADARTSRRRDPSSRAAAWAALPPASRLSYASRQAPGEASPTSFAIDKDTVDPEQAYRRFAIVDCSLDQVDYLHLRSQGHLRAGFQRDDRWRGHWRVP